jgi:hypothetical protein
MPIYAENSDPNGGGRFEEVASYLCIMKFVGIYLSRLKKIYSLANKPRLDKHEKPTNARVKNMSDRKCKFPSKSTHVSTYPADSGGQRCCF